MGIYDQGTEGFIDPYVAQAEANQKLSLQEAFAQGQSYGNSMNNSRKKQERLSVSASNKRDKLRKDDLDYGDDGAFISGAKSFANEFLPHDYQLAVNKDGKRYNTENKIFNDEDLSGAWNNIEEDPNGDKVLYYLRKRDGLNEDGSQKWLYKPGIAHIGAADRYKGQLQSSEWELLGEKRFNEASTLEKQIHGNKSFLESRAFDMGRSSEDKRFADEKGLAYNDFGAGKTELYTRDILGVLDNSTEESRALAKAKSEAAYKANLLKPYQRNDMFEAVDAFQAAGQGLVGKGVKLAGQIVSNVQNTLTGQETTGDGAIESYGKKLMRDAAADWGYNDSTMKAGAAQMRAGFREGNVVDFVIGMVKAAPQAVAGSIPESAAYFGGGPGTIAAKIASLAVANANDELDSREIANGGRKATATEIAGVMAGEAFATALDAGALRFVTKGLPGLGLRGEGGVTVDFAKAMKKMPSSTKFEMLKSLSKAGGRAGGAFATEAAQETTTEAIRMLAETLGTTKYGDDAMAILQSTEGKGRLQDAAFLGGAGGVGFGSVRNASKTAKDINQDLKTGKKLNDGATAGQSAANMGDAQAKKIFAEENIQQAKQTVERFNTTTTSVNEAKTLDELKKAVSESGLPPAQIENTLGIIEKAKESDIVALKESLHSTINTLRNGVITDAQANTQALDGLNQAIEGETVGEDLPSTITEVDQYQATKSQMEQDLSALESARNQAEAVLKQSTLYPEAEGSIPVEQAQAQFDELSAQFAAGQTEYMANNDALVQAVRDIKSPELRAEYEAIMELEAKNMEIKQEVARGSNQSIITKLQAQIATNDTKIAAMKEKAATHAANIKEVPSIKTTKKGKVLKKSVKNAAAVEEANEFNLKEGTATEEDIETSEQAQVRAKRTLNKLEKKEVKNQSKLKETTPVEERRQKADELAGEVDIEAAAAYDPVGEQVSSAKQEASKIGEKLSQKKKKSGIARKIVKAILSRGKSLKMVKSGFTEKLKTLSTEALRQLNTDTELTEMQKMLTGKNGYQPYSKQMIKDAVEKQLRNRNVSDKFFQKGADLSAASRKYEDPVAIGRALYALKAIRNKLETEYDAMTEEEAGVATKEYFDQVHSVLSQLEAMDLVAFRRFANGGLIEGINSREAFNDVLLGMAGTGSIEANQQIEARVKRINERADGTLSTQARKDFAFKIAKSNVTEDIEAIETAKADVQFLQDNKTLTEAQAETLLGLLDGVTSRSKAHNIAFAEAVAQANAQTADQIDEDIKNNESMSEKTKKTILNYPDNMKIQLMNVFGVIDNDTLRTLQGLGINTDSVVFEGNEGTITVNIGKDC